MGVKQSTNTKKTFIEVSREERCKVDDSFMLDPRMTQSEVPNGNNLSMLGTSILENKISTEYARENEGFVGGPQKVNAAEAARQRWSEIPVDEAAEDLMREERSDGSPTTVRTPVNLAECLGPDRRGGDQKCQWPNQSPYGANAMIPPGAVISPTYGGYPMMQQTTGSPGGVVFMPMSMMVPGARSLPGTPSTEQNMLHHGSFIELERHSYHGSVPPSPQVPQSPQVPPSPADTVSSVSTTASGKKKKQPRSAEKEKKREACNEEVPTDADKSTWTTRMIRNLPNDYTRKDLLDLLDSNNVLYDFVYLPIDWGKRANLGYAFVNLASPPEAERMESVLGGYAGWKVASEKVCEVVWGKPDQQSLRKNIERFRNSPVMHPDVPEEFKPLLFTLGERTVFPAPTRRLRPPRGFQRKSGDGAEREASSTPSDSDI